MRWRITSARCMDHLTATSAAGLPHRDARDQAAPYSGPSGAQLAGRDSTARCRRGSNDEKLSAMPSAGIRNLACRPAQRHLCQIFAELRAKLQAAFDGGLFSLSRYALRRLGARPGAACRTPKARGIWCGRISAISPPFPARAAIGSIVPGRYSEARRSFFSRGQRGQGTLAFFDRRERMHFTPRPLHIPQLQDGARLVKMSADPRQAMCYQCHGPRIPETGTRCRQRITGVRRRDR